MKKLLIILCASIICITGKVFAETEKVILDEDFESYNVGDIPKGWSMPDDVEGGSYGRIAVDPNDPDNLCFAMNASGGAAKFVLMFEPTGGITTIECRMRMSDSKNDTHWMFDNDMLMDNMVYRHQWVHTNARGSGGVPNFTINHETWYSAKYEIDFYNQTFAYWFEGIEVYTDMPFRIPDQASIDNMYWKFRWDTTYVDDIKITNKGGISKIYTTLESNDYYIYKLNRFIWEVNPGTLTERFMQRLKFVDGAEVTLLDTDGKTVYDGAYVKNGMIVCIESPDKQQHVEYTVRLRGWIIGSETAKYLKEAVAFYNDSPYMVTKNKRRLIDDNDYNATVFTEDDVMYLPLRALCDGVGKSVSYDDTAAKAVVDGSIEIKPDTSYIKINGQKKNLDNTCKIIEGRIFVPLNWAKIISGMPVCFNSGGLVIFRDSEFSARDSVMEYIIAETINYFTAD